MNRHELRIRGERMGVRDPDRIDTGIVLENVRLTARVARLEALLLRCIADYLHETDAGFIAEIDRAISHD